MMRWYKSHNFTLILSWTGAKTERTILCGSQPLVVLVLGWFLFGKILCWIPNYIRTSSLVPMHFFTFCSLIPRPWLCTPSFSMLHACFCAHKDNNMRKEGERESLGTRLSDQTSFNCTRRELIFGHYKTIFREITLDQSDCRIKYDGNSYPKDIPPLISPATTP